MNSQYGCRYVGTARESRVVFPSLQSVKDMNKKFVTRGSLAYVSFDDILVSRWKDNNIVIILSTDVDVGDDQYDKEVKRKVLVTFPSVIAE